MPRLLEGDYNSNGPVEQGDLDPVLLNWGEELAKPCDAGWINDFPSGLIEQDELDAVLLNWGSSIESPGAHSVPAPATLALVLTLAFLSCCFGRS